MLDVMGSTFCWMGLSPSIKKYLYQSYNDPKNLPYNCAGNVVQQLPCMTNHNRLQDCKVKASLLVENNIVAKCRADIFGEPIVLASSNWMLINVRGKKLDKLIIIDMLSVMLEELEVNKNSILFTRCYAVMLALSLAISNFDSGYVGI